MATAFGETMDSHTSDITTSNSEEQHLSSNDVTLLSDRIIIDTDPSLSETESTGWLPSWKPTSKEKLVEAEQLVLNRLTSQYSDKFVQIGDNMFIRTVSIAPDEPVQADQSPLHPLVMVHGFGCGLGCFYKNLDHLHRKRHLYAFDVLGFGRSSRTTFGDDPETVEDEFVESIEKWRHVMGIDKMILLGHSLGGFMSMAYALKYPDRVRHLILVDPWGFREQPQEIDTSSNPRMRRYKYLIPVVQAYVKVFNPFTMIRAIGPLGPKLISNFRRDLSDMFGEEFMDYVYHCNAQNPTGESGFFHLHSSIVFARRPMLLRLNQLPDSLPMSVLFGGQSRFDHSYNRDLYLQRPNSFTDIHFVDEAGHHIHAHTPEVFNDVVNGVCDMVDSSQDIFVNTRQESDAFHHH